MAASPRQADDRQDETGLHNHYCNGWTVCVTRPMWYSCTLLNFFHPRTAAKCGVYIRLAASCGEWRRHVQWSITSSPWCSPTNAINTYHTLLRLIVSMDYPVCSGIGQSTEHLMPVCMGLTFARSFAIIMKLQNVLCIYICLQMNKHGVLQYL